MIDRYTYLEGSQWQQAMMNWAEGGKAVSKNHFPWQDWTQLLLKQRMHLFYQREWFIEQFGYTLPNAEFIQNVLEYGPFLEIGAGSGLLSCLLAQAGSDIVATDIGESYYNFKIGHWFPVQTYHAQEALHIFPNRTVLLAWPCYQQNWATEILELLKPKQKLIYIGEWKNGCNANDSFFNLLNHRFLKIQKLPWKPFPYIQDEATVFQKI